MSAPDNLKPRDLFSIRPSDDLPANLTRQQAADLVFDLADKLLRDQTASRERSGVVLTALVDALAGARDGECRFADHVRRIAAGIDAGRNVLRQTSTHLQDLIDAMIAEQDEHGAAEYQQ